MQSNKASKKPTIVDEPGASVPEISTAAEKTGTPRASRSSKLKKETSEMGPAKHRKSSSPEPVIERSPVVKTTAPTAAGYANAVASPVIDSVGVMTPSRGSAELGTRSAEISPSHEEIAKLAHSYWVARGHAPGSPEEDWVRAERELKVKR